MISVSPSEMAGTQGWLPVLHAIGIYMALSPAVVNT